MRSSLTTFAATLLWLACTSAEAAVGGQASDIFLRLKPLVFQIKTASSESAPKSSYGTGWVVRKDGLLITNFHVVADSVLEPDRYKVFLVDSEKSWPATVLHVNPINDLALLRVGKSFPSEVAISADMPRQGAPVYSLGQPEDLNMSIVEGVYNGVLEEGPFSKVHLSSPINSGMSGGPTVDGRGRVVGVNVSRKVFSNNVSFSVPKHEVELLLENAAAEIKSAAAPTALALEKSITEQLKVAGKELFALVTDKKNGTRKFEAWELPAQPKQIHCWGDTERVLKGQKYSSKEEACHLQNSAFLGDEADGAEYSLNVDSLANKGLNGVQWFKLLSKTLWAASKSDRLHSKMHRDRLSEMTAPRCTARKLKNAHGIAMVGHTCIRQYVRYAGLYEISVDAGTLLKGKNNLVVAARMSSLSLEDAMNFNRYILDSIRLGDEDAH